MQTEINFKQLGKRVVAKRLEKIDAKGFAQAFRIC